tara:strand:- start:16423 stop:16584 length:162 start_codon:yes stop_codon:yes gene_type:complete
MLEVKFHQILQVWVIGLRGENENEGELLVHPDGHILQFDSKQEAEKAIIGKGN